MIKLVLKAGKEKPLEGRHPWVYSGAIDEIDEDYKTGDLVKVYSSKNQFLGTGYLNPHSQIAVRMLSFEEEEINRAFFERQIEAALELRRRFVPSRTNAYRVIHSEGDFLPGLIVDRYGDYLVVQFQTAGIDAWRETLLDLLEEKVEAIHEWPLRGIYERDDSEARVWEGLRRRIERLRGEEPPDFVEIEEYGIPFLVDIHAGQKTGFFLDQRENRKLIARFAEGKRVLNLFAYTGGFSVYAAKAGASSVVSVETSERALNLSRENFKLNGFTPSPLPSPPSRGRGRGEGEEEGERYQFIRQDAFNYLRETSQEFDLVILDPPAFAQAKDHVMKASRAYKDVNLWAMKRLAQGGLLYTSSCSSYIDSALFQKIIFAAAKDARANLQILAKTSHPPDHPLNLYHPEGEYLKGLFCQIQ